MYRLTMSKVLFVALFALVAVSSAHPTLYATAPDAPMPEDPPIFSWHAHIVYMLSDDSVEEALALRAKTEEAFKDYLGKECTGRFDAGRLCMIRDHDFKEILTEGPFPAGEWSIFIPNSHYALVVPWLLQHRGKFSLLIHPNTGYMYEDHSIWAQWSGDSWPLNLVPQIIGKPHEKSGEKHHQPGDAANPVCLDSNTDNNVCGTKESGPVVPCCDGYACHCGGKDSNGLCYCKQPAIRMFI